MNRVNFAKILRIHALARLGLPLVKLMCVFTMTYSYAGTVASAEECQTLIPTYQESLLRFQEAQKLYLSTGCNELSEREMSDAEDPRALKCKKLRMGLQEIQSVTHMLGLRLQALSCKRHQPSLSACDRLKIMIDKACGLRG